MSNDTMVPGPMALIQNLTWKSPVDNQSSVVDPKKSDIIIPIMGPTGFGKSSIINDIAGKAVMPVSHGLQPCTKSIQHVVLSHPNADNNRRIILVDTPGIVEDPTDEYPKVDEAQILERVHRWVKHSYGKAMRVTGIVYLYDITQPRVLSTFGQPSINTSLFKKLCGENYFQRIILAATKWDDITVTPEIRLKREEELRSTYWAGMGPTIIKIHSDSSTWGLVNHILEISGNISGPTPTFPKATVPKGDLKVSRRLAVHTAREIPDKFKVIEPNPDDIVIAIIGPMGVGKSSVINTIAGRTVMEVRHDLQQQCTPSLIQYVPIPHPHDSSRRIILVDTPGFDKTYENWEILRRTCVWLENSYGKEKKLSGIICLHDISQKALFQMSDQNLTMFKQLCGNDGLANIILGTTKWDKLTREAGLESERQLTDGYWKKMVQSGSTMMRVQNDESSTQKVIECILDNVDYNHVQDELREVQKIVPRTEHGDILRKKLRELLSEMDLQLKDRATRGGDEGYQQKLGDIRTRMGETIVQVAKLKVPLSPRIKTFFRADPTKQPAPMEQEAFDNRRSKNNNDGLINSAGTRGKLTKDMAEKCLDLMTVEDPKESDIVIPIMGPTGAGKSTLINQIMGKQAAVVSHGLESCTSSIQHVITRHPSVPDRRIILVDTPGFDDTYVDDAEILNRIALWLARSYHDEMNLAGIVYLHDMCLPRFTGSILKNLDMFKKLCGDDALRNVVLGTTKWSLINRQETGEKREQQLRDSFWKDMINHGSVIRRVRDDPSSAREILDHIIRNKAVESVLIQGEVVDERIPIPETTAGKTLRYTQEQFEALKKKREKSRQMGKDVQF